MITEQARGDRGSTRERLIAAGLRLFAEQGYRATTVGDIEAAAGLQPRRGALYRHFASKHALLEAGVQGYIDDVTSRRDELVTAPLGDLRSEAVLLARYALAALDVQRDITRLFERDGDRISELRDVFQRDVGDYSYTIVLTLLRRWIGSSAEGLDLEALTVVLLGSLINFRRAAWTFGKTSLGIDDERMVQAWADLCVTAVQSHT